MNNSENSSLISDQRIWLTDLTYTQQAVSADLIPQAIGGIATFTETQINLRQPIRLFKYPEKLASALESEGPPDIIGFSNYIWNSRLASSFAKQIKEMSPQTIVIFGGPHYPILASGQEEVIAQRPEIDFYIIKEGELAFSKLVIALHQNNNRKNSLHGKISSVHSRDEQGKVYLNDSIDRIRDLTEIPSPYVTHRLDEFFDGKLLPIIQTNRGCPFNCTFCVEGVKYYNKIYKNSNEKVACELHYIGKMMEDVRKKGGRNDLFIADSNFGMYKDDYETCLTISKCQKDYQWPEYINVATGKNQKERVLKAASLINGALRLSGSVQSFDPEILENIKRKNISTEELMKLALEAAEVGANSYCETILCLPGDSKEKHYKTLQRAIEAGFNMVSTFQLMLLPGSEMCNEETREKFGMEIRHRVFPRCYGYFDVSDKKLISAEIEEVCVGLNTLSFEDYLECRKTHLVIHIFHNDGIFKVLLKFLRSMNLPVYRWIELIRDFQKPEELENLFEQFVEDTKNELWTDKAELEEFIQQPGTIYKFVNGELGNNLLFTYKTKAMINHVNDLAETAKRALLQVLQESGKSPKEYSTFVEEALVFHCFKLKDIFNNFEKVFSTPFHYNIKKYEEDIEVSPIANYLNSAPIECEFFLDQQQIRLVQRNLEVFGNNPWGIGRMLTKVFVKKLLRKTSMHSATSPSSQHLSKVISIDA